MHDVLLVRRLEGRERLIHQRQHLPILELASLADAALLERFAFEQLHHQERDAVLGQAVVVSGHGAAVPDLIGRIALHEEALTGVLIDGDLRVQDLDRDALGVAMCRCVDRCHTTHPDQLVEVPPAIEECADARLRAQCYEVGLFHVGPSPRKYGRSEGRIKARAGEQTPTRAAILRPISAKSAGNGEKYWEIKARSAVSYRSFVEYSAQGEARPSVHCRSTQ
jgi:hypothetical protein